MRGERTHQKDGSDLIGVCRTCHDFMHSNNKHNTRALVETIIQQVIKRATQAKESGEDVPELLRDKMMEARGLAHTMHQLINR